MGNDSAYALQSNLVKEHVKSEYYYYEMQFQLDTLFGLKFVQKLDRKFQLFLSKCMDRPSLKVIGPSACDLSSFIEDVENGIFIGSLPPALSSDSSRLQSDSPGKKDKKKSTSNGSVNNKSKKPEWQIGDKRVGEVFSKEALSKIPEFKTGVSCCARFASKGYCFDNCSLRESHCEWPTDVQKAYHK